MRDTLDLLIGFFLHPAFIYGGTGAFIGAAIFAAWDWFQGTAGKPWKSITRNNPQRGA